MNRLYRNFKPPRSVAAAPAEGAHAALPYFKSNPVVLIRPLLLCMVLHYDMWKQQFGAPSLQVCT